MITLEMQNQYASLFNEAKEKGMTPHEQGVYADAPFVDLIATIKDRGTAWNKLREVLHAQNNEKRLAADREKRQKAAAKRTISKVAKELLARGLAGKEYEFIRSIQKKRTLTERQAKWFDDICRANHVTLAEYGQRKSSLSNCRHEDLGSLGYKHGATVKCPHCGSMAEVW